MIEISADPDERAVLLRWKKRSDTMVLIRMKAEAILYASMSVDAKIIASTLDRSSRTVSEWLRDWNVSRLQSVVTGHAGNENAAKLTREQKDELKKVLESPPSEAGVSADFWDVPALEDVVKTKFGVEYESESSYQLLMRFLGMSFKRNWSGTGRLLWFGQAAAGIQGWSSVSMTKASNRPRPCLAAVDR